MSERFPREERLNRGDDIRAVRKSGACIRGHRVTMYIAEAQDYRVGVITPRRVGGAVQRNRARRILREALRRIRPLLRPDRAASILVIARPEIAGARGGEVRTELEALLTRHGLLE